jgi:predicted Zn-dependent protease
VVLVVALAWTIGCASSGARKQAGASPKRTVLLTSTDDVRVGAEAAKQVAVEVGLLDDPLLGAYVAGIGRKLLGGLPRRDFAYHFAIVDDMEPNAFALPGGFIYVSRGLLALVNDEDELACVLGHEIVHVAFRHAAQQQEVARQQRPLSLPISRASTLASYERDMEREADAVGQRLCGAAGYDPMAMATFMRRLDQRERLLIGTPRNPTFLDTHPGARERAAVDSARAGELRWTRDPSLGDVRARYLDRIDGLVIGDRPETGVFDGEWFFHPGLDFQMRFPKGWLLQNSSRAVGAVAPRHEAAVFLAGDPPPGDLVAVADAFAAKAKAEQGVELTAKTHVRLGEIEAVRYGFRGGKGPYAIAAEVTFFPFAGATWRMVAVAPLTAAERYFATIQVSTRSFGPLSPENRARIETRRLRVAVTRPGEDVVSLGERTGCVLSPSGRALLNGLLGNEVFAGGERMKIVRREGAGSSR